MEEYFHYRAENPKQPLLVGSYLQSWEKNQRTAIKNKEEGIKTGYQISTYQYQTLLERKFQKETREPKGFSKVLSFCLKCCTTFVKQNQHTDYFKDDALFLNNDGENCIAQLRAAVTQVRNHKKYIGKDKRDRLGELGIELHPNACTELPKKKRRSKAEMSAYRRALTSSSHRKGSDSTSSIPPQRDEESDSMSSESDTSVANFGRKKPGSRKAPAKKRSTNLGRPRVGRKRY